MLILAPTKFRKHRGRMKQVVPARVPGPPLHVLNVVSVGFPAQPGRCYWVFDNPLTVVGNPIGLRVQIDGVWADPISATQDGVNSISAIYNTAETLGGKAFSIIATPAGIVQAMDIVLPQSGTIITT